MQKQKQIGDLIKSTIKIKQLQSCGGDELNKVVENKTIKAHLSPFSSGGQMQFAHTPQDMIHRQFSQNNSNDETDKKFILFNRQNSEKNQDQVSFNPLKNEYVNSSGQVVTSKSGGSSSNQNYQAPKQSKFFTFDGNTIFNPKNPVSPARGHLATTFVRQKLGRDRYEKVLKILSQADDPLFLLDFSQDFGKRPAEVESQQKMILKLINNDMNFISIFQYIVNCSLCSSNKSSHSKGNQSQSQNSTYEQLSQQFTPNSVSTNNYPNVISPDNQSNQAQASNQPHYGPNSTKNQETTTRKMGRGIKNSEKNYTPSTQYTNNLMSDGQYQRIKTGTADQVVPNLELKK